jgi:hypothetical protein
MMRLIRAFFALFICTFALALPYGVRLRYMQSLAWLAHQPFRVFGALTRWMLAQLGEKNPYEPRR